MQDLQKLLWGRWRDGLGLHRCWFGHSCNGCPDMRSGKNIKGYRVRQKMVDGKLVITMEKIPGWRMDTSAQIRQRKSKRIKVQRPLLLGLFSPVKKES